MLARAPGFTAVALITLALGIGATTAVFSVVHGVLLTPLPYPEPDRLVRVFGPRRPIAGIDGPPSRWSISGRRRSKRCDSTTRAFSHVAGYMPTTLTLTGRAMRFGSSAHRCRRRRFRCSASRRFVAVLSSRGEEAAGADAVVVLSEATWRRYFNADEAFIGQIVTLDGRGRTVVGVMPGGFSQPGCTFPIRRRNSGCRTFRRRPTSGIA